jgi:ribonucleoside-diphosphate reductase alpha chain
MAQRKRLPNKRGGIRIVIGKNKDCVHLSTGEYADGTLGEIFLVHQREGTFGRDMLNAFAMAVSLGLQHGVSLAAFHHTFRNFTMEPDLIRGVFEELELHYGAKPTKEEKS